MITIITGSVIAFNHLKSYFNAKRGVANLFAAAVCTFLCTSCSSTNGNASYKTSEEAVNAYAKFLSDVKMKDNVSSSDLTTLAKDWRTTNDSVTACLMRDTTMTIHGDWSKAYQPFTTPYAVSSSASSCHAHAPLPMWSISKPRYPHTQRTRT